MTTSEIDYILHYLKSYIPCKIADLEQYSDFELAGKNDGMSRMIFYITINKTNMVILLKHRKFMSMRLT